MPPVGFGYPIPTSERPQTHDLERAATGIGNSCIPCTKLNYNPLRNSIKWYSPYRTLVSNSEYFTWTDAVRCIVQYQYENSSVSILTKVDVNLFVGTLTYHGFSWEKFNQPVSIQFTVMWCRVMWWIFTVISEELAFSISPSHPVSLDSTFLCKFDTFLQNFMAAHTIKPAVLTVTAVVTSNLARLTDLLYRWVTAAHCANYTRHLNALCWRNVQFFNVDASVLYRTLPLNSKCTSSGTLVLSIGVSTRSFELRLK